MSSSDFHDELSNAIALRALGGDYFQIQAFGEELAQRLEEAEVFFDISIEPLRCTGRNRKGLALLGYAEDAADDSLIIIAGAHFAEPGRTLTRSDAKLAFDSAAGFLEQSKDGWLSENLEISSKESAHASYFSKQLEHVQKLKFVLVTDGTMSDRIRVIESDVVCGIPASYSIWDLKRFEDLANSVSGLDEFTVDLTKWVPEGLPCLVGAESISHAKTYLTILPGRLLADVYKEYGSQLLESNVRTYLSARGKVNKGIQVTLANDPDMFLAYNNGLTTTATGVEVSHGPDGPRITKLNNWQIVNGGQTTASLTHFMKAGSGRDLDGVYVAMKLVTVEAESAPKLVGQISRFANSQNAVSEADLFSNSPFHVRLEQISRRVMAPAEEGRQHQAKWFYERARGQYENERNAHTPAGQRKFDLEYPKAHRITKTDWAKYAFSWSQRPWEVSKGAQTNFMEFAKLASDTWAKEPDSVNDGYYRAGVAKAILFTSLRASIMKSDWYESGYLANIVTYSISKFTYELGAQFDGRKLDLEKVWKRQGPSPETLRAMTGLAEHVRLVLMNPSGGQRNVTQWAKQQACWDAVRRASTSLDRALEADLVEASDEKARATTARRERQVDDGLEAITRVLNVPRATWGTIKTDGTKVGIVSPTDLDLIALVERGGLPSDRQASRLLAILDRAREATLILDSEN